MFAACASIVLAGAGSDLLGPFVHESGSDRDAVAISITVEAGADGKISLSLVAAHPDAHGAARSETVDAGRARNDPPHVQEEEEARGDQARGRHVAQTLLFVRLSR